MVLRIIHELSLSLYQSKAFLLREVGNTELARVLELPSNTYCVGKNLFYFNFSLLLRSIQKYISFI